jgi:hypothetical protein
MKRILMVLLHSFQEQNMASRAQVSRELRRLFEEEAEPLARREGLRQRGMRFAQLAYLLVLGWWQQPQAGPSALARFAGSLNLTLSKQEVDVHFTEATASFLLALLRRAVCVLICARQGVKLALLQQFQAVLVEDASTITLPEALKGVWRGCGGSASKAGTERATEAALKVTVRFDLLGGGMDGPHVQAGRQHELRSVLREHVMAPGSLWIADLGYWTLKWLDSLVQGGVYFLLRYKPGIILWHEGERLDAAKRSCPRPWASSWNCSSRWAPSACSRGYASWPSACQPRWRPSVRRAIVSTRAPMASRSIPWWWN